MGGNPIIYWVINKNSVQQIQQFQYVWVMHTAIEKEVKEGEFYNFIISNYQKRLELIKIKEEIQNINKLPIEQKNELKEIENKVKRGKIITFRPLECKANMVDDERLLVCLLYTSRCV